MISPKVTTFGISHDRLARGAHVRDDAARPFAPQHADSRRPAIAFGVEQRRADADRHGAGPDPVAGVVERDAAGRHQLHLRQRPAHVLEVTRAERRRRKHLDDVGAGLPRVENLGRREAAGHRRHVALVAGRDDVRPEHRADDELRAGVDHARRAVSASSDRAGAEQEPGRQRRRELRDQLDRARHRHRHLERADAPFGERVDDGAQLGRILHADDRDDPGLLDRRRQRVPPCHYQFQSVPSSFRFTGR